MGGLFLFSPATKKTIGHTSTNVTMIEIWKDIEGYKGYYQVSSRGRVKGLLRTIDKGYYGKQVYPETIMNTFESNGYIMVTLRKDGTKHNYKVHRLVAKAFIPNPNNYPCINHKDCNRKNNTVENLEWCTYYYNNHYRFTNKAA